MDRNYPVYPLGMDTVRDRFFDREGSYQLPPLDLCSGASGFDASKFLDSDLQRSAMSGLMKYGHPSGQADFRAQIAAFLSNMSGADISPSRVFITDGGSGALTTALMVLLQPGEDAIVPKVFFPSYPLLIHMIGATCKFGSLDADLNMTAETIRAAMTDKTALALINSPGNPLGNLMSRKQIEAVCDLGIPVISDEVYSFLTPGERATSILEVSQDHFVIGSFSKTYAAAGIRMGYLVVPEKWIDVVFALRASLNICPSLPGQKMAMSLLANHDTVVGAHKEYIAKQRELFRELCRVNAVKLVTPPQCGYFGAIDVSDAGGRSSLDVALALVDEFSMATAPGGDFAQEDPHFLRVNYSYSAAGIEAGVARLRACIQGLPLR